MWLKGMCTFTTYAIQAHSAQCRHERSQPHPVSCGQIEHMNDVIVDLEIYF